jgi:hypothetical protein
MAKKTHLIVGSVLIVFGVLLSGCEIGKSTGGSEDVSISERPGVTLKGKLTSTGDKYFLKDEIKTTEITSRKLDLKSRVGTDVEIYGEFSGTTLYVDEMK